MKAIRAAEAQKTMNFNLDDSENHITKQTNIINMIHDSEADKAP